MYLPKSYSECVLVLIENILHYYSTFYKQAKQIVMMDKKASTLIVKILAKRSGVLV